MLIYIGYRVEMIAFFVRFFLKKLSVTSSATVVVFGVPEEK